MMPSRLALLSSSLLAAAMLSPQTTSAEPQAFVAEITFTKQAALPYLLFTPEGYDPAGDERWPLVIFLHGAGERGDQLDKVKAHGPPKLAADGPLPYLLVAPQCPAGEVWDPDLIEALAELISTGHAVDQDRVYLTGLSMGGYGTWDTIFKHPARWAAAAPICGGAGIRILSVDKIRQIPIRAYHGAKDTVVLPSESQKIVDRLKAAGADAELTIYPDAGHDSWTETYGNPDFWSWLLSQRRAPAP
jgi:predicted peptidase